MGERIMQEIPENNINPRISKDKKVICGPVPRKKPRDLADYTLQLNKHGLSVFDT